MQVADQPDNGCCKRHHKKEKNDLAVSSLFAHRTRAPGTSAFALVLRRHGDAKSSIASVVLCSLLRPVFLDLRHLRNKPLEFFKSFPQVRFLPCYFFLPSANRQAGSGRTTKHRHYLLAIQTKRARAIAPKIMRGNVSAT